MYGVVGTVLGGKKTTTNKQTGGKQDERKKRTRKKERKKYVNGHSQPTSLLSGNCLKLRKKNKELDRIKGNKADLQTHSQHMCNARRVWGIYKKIVTETNRWRVCFWFDRFLSNE